MLGLTFTRAGIEALTPPGTDLDEALNALRTKEILGVDSDPRSPERGQYRFVQALFRGAALLFSLELSLNPRHLGRGNCERAGL